MRTLAVALTLLAVAAPASARSLGLPGRSRADQPKITSLVTKKGIEYTVHIPATARRLQPISSFANRRPSEIPADQAEFSFSFGSPATVLGATKHIKFSAKLVENGGGKTATIVVPRDFIKRNARGRTPGLTVKTSEHTVLELLR
jgi:hypothetical protein